jgi:hypothetical protein
MLHSKALVGGLFLLATIGDVDASPTKRWPSPLPALTLNKYDKEIFDVAMTGPGSRLLAISRRTMMA